MASRCKALPPTPREGVWGGGDLSMDYDMQMGILNGLQGASAPGLRQLSYMDGIILRNTLPPCGRRKAHLLEDSAVSEVTPAPPGACHPVVQLSRKQMAARGPGRERDETGALPLMSWVTLGSRLSSPDPRCPVGGTKVVGEETRRSPSRSKANSLPRFPA